MILPDTNILIAYFSKVTTVESLLDIHIRQRTILFSVICVSEFLVKARPQEINILKKLITSLKLIPIDQPIMEQAVVYRKRVVKKSKRVYLLDCFIAATAKVHRAILVTANPSDFPFKDIQVKQPQDIPLLT